MALNFRRHFFEVLPSTQSYLKAWALQEPLPEGTLVWARHQSAGYGRKGSPWYSTPGESLTFSFLVRPERGITSLTAQTALALYETVAPFCRETLYLKWPNDLWSPQGKLAGLLVEALWKGTHLQHACIGVGLNVYQPYFPPDLRAASLAQVGQPPDHLEVLLAEFERAFTRWYTAPTPAVRMAFLERLQRKGQFHTPDGPVEATLLDWEPEGWLWLETPQGPTRYLAAAVQMLWPYSP